MSWRPGECSARYKSNGSAAEGPEEALREAACDGVLDPVLDPPPSKLRADLRVGTMNMRRAASVARRCGFLCLFLAWALTSRAATYDVREVKQSALDDVKLQRAALTTIPSPPPPLLAALDAIIAALEASLRGPGGESRHSDHAHLVAPPAGTAAFEAGVDAVALLGSLPVSGGSFDAWRNGAAARLRSRLVEAHVYLADVALQEARGRIVLQAMPGDVSAATAHLAAGRAAVELSSLNVAMQALKSSWQESIAATPAAPPQVGERPTVNVRAPGDGAILIGESSSVVTGMVGDIVAGTVDETVLTVVVNAAAAVESHRTYMTQGVPLESGVNAIVAVVRDTSGNVTSAASATWTHASPPLPTVPGSPSVSCACGLRYLAGNLQQAPILTTLAQLLSVRVLGPSGTPLPGMPVIFRVVEGDGFVAGSLRVVQAMTDSMGTASTTFTLGRRAGVGANRVRAIIPGVSGEVLFSAIADTIAPDRIAVLMGTNERAGVATIVAGSVAAFVTDGGQNPVENVPVTFRVTKGNGLVNDLFEDIVYTNADGVADVRWTLGTTPGLDNNVVEATFPGLTRQPAVFVASGFVLGAPAYTTVSGIVLDGQGAPVPGCTMSVVGAAAAVETAKDGTFQIFSVPVGPIKLNLDASTTTRPGTWSSMTYDMITLTGVDNQLPRPIYILPLALADGEIANETTDVVIDVPGVPGLSLTVPAGSAHFPGGGTSGLVSVTTVHADRIPMAPGSAMQPRTIVSIDPHDITFDPPAIFQVPNADGLAPGTVTEMFSFDHVLGMFVAIGTGTVSENGLTLRSDPGFGVLHGGWHCATPQAESGASSPLEVWLTEPSDRPIAVAAGLTRQVRASGTPDRGSHFTWTATGAVTVAPDLCELCHDDSEPVSPTCGAVLTGTAAPGTGTVKVTYECCTTEESAEDAADVVVFKAFVDSANICGNQVVVRLDGAGLHGTCKVEAVRGDGTAWTINEEDRAAGTFSTVFHFDTMPTDANGIFDSVRATWTVQGQISESDPTTARFQNLGEFNNTQYNTPWESDATCQDQGSANVCFSTAACAWTEGTLYAHFSDEVTENGSGESISHGTVLIEAWCLTHTPPPGIPSACVGRAKYRANGNLPGPSCGGTVSDVTVAVNPSHPFLGCGDQVCIIGVAQKTVNDQGGGVGLHQLDNYTTRYIGCTGTPSLGVFPVVKLR